MRKIRLFISALVIFLIYINTLSAQNTITVRFRSAQENTSLSVNIRHFTFHFNDEGRLVEYRIEDQLENRARKPRRIVTFQDHNEYILYSRSDFRQGELTNKEQRIIYRKQDGYEVIRSTDPGGTPDLFYTRTTPSSFTQIYKNMEIYAIYFSPIHLAINNIYHDDPSIQYIYESGKLDHVLYGSRLYSEAEYAEENIHITYPTPDMGDGNIYVYIGDDYVPPADNMIRAFNAFLMPGEYQGYLLPFLVGYF